MALDLIADYVREALTKAGRPIPHVTGRIYDTPITVVVRAPKSVWNGCSGSVVAERNFGDASDFLVQVGPLGRAHRLGFKREELFCPFGEVL